MLPTGKPGGPCNPASPLSPGSPKPPVSPRSPLGPLKNYTNGEREKLYECGFSLQPDDKILFQRELKPRNLVTLLQINLSLLKKKDK